MRRNILVGKIGRTIKFSNNKIETGSGNELILFSAIARMHPDWMLYIVGPNELFKIEGTEAYDKMFPAHNIKSVFAQDRAKWDGRYDVIVDNIRKECGDQIDAAVFISGMAAAVNVPGLLRKPDGSDYSILNSYLTYAAPYIHVLNEIGCPFYVVAEDARYITINGRDLFNRERLILTQYNGEVEAYKHILSKDDIVTQTVTKHKAIYANIEKIPLMGVRKEWAKEFDVVAKAAVPFTENRFMVLSNGCGTSKINHAGNNSSRLPVYKEWVKDAMKDTRYEGSKVYGIWDANIYEENDWIQHKLIVDMEKEISECRYSLVYSQVRGFVTAKAYELICLGIIPFIHPDYDPHRLLKLPEYIYVSSPTEMLAKMAAMDKDDQLYMGVLSDCIKAMDKEEYYDGTLVVNSIFNPIAKDLGWEGYEEGKPVEVIFDHFSKHVYNYGKMKFNSRKN